MHWNENFYYKQQRRWRKKKHYYYLNENWDKIVNWKKIINNNNNFTAVFGLSCANTIIHTLIRLI